MSWENYNMTSVLTQMKQCYELQTLCDFNVWENVSFLGDFEVHLQWVDSGAQLLETLKLISNIKHNNN